jgi:hypothetical protein
MTETLFRIGGVYRNNAGKLQRIIGPSAHPNPERHFFQVSLLAEDGSVIFSDDGSRFINGTYFGDPTESASLLPGELHQINGEWVPRGVPVEDKPAETLGELLRRALNPGPSHSTPATQQQDKPAEPSKTPLFDHLRRLRESGQGPAAVEVPRPALTWADSKPFDAFGGFFTEPADMADWQDTYYPR